MKGLEALKDIVEIAIAHCCAEEAHQVAFKSETIEKELKALEIIKNKLSPLAKMTFLPMTQEEYELVEEVLKDD